MGFPIVLFYISLVIQLVYCNSDKCPENHLLEEISSQLIQSKADFEQKLEDLDAKCRDREVKLLTVIENNKNDLLNDHLPNAISTALRDLPYVMLCAYQV